MKVSLDKDVLPPFKVAHPSDLYFDIKDDDFLPIVECKSYLDGPGDQGSKKIKVAVT